MMARPNLSRYRLALTLIPAVVVGFGLFLVAALLVRQRAPPAVAVVPQAVVLLPRVPPHPVALGGKSGSRKAATGMVQAGADGPLLRVPPPLFSPSPALPTPGLSGAKTQIPMRFAAPGQLNRLVAAATVNFLGLDGRGHGHQKWVGGGGGLFYLPDSGIRVRQLRYTCSQVPINDKSKTMTAFVSALVTRTGRVTNVSIPGATIEGAPADSIRKGLF